MDGADAFKLKLTKKSGKVEYHYLDAETYLLVKEEGTVKRRGTEMEGESTFSDYKDVNGYMMPFSMEQGAKGMPARQKMAFTKIEVNVPLDFASNSPFALSNALFANSLRPSRPVGHATMMHRSPGRGRLSMRALIRPRRIVSVPPRTGTFWISPRVSAAASIAGR